MKIKEIKAKSIIVKSNLPDSDFVINPYTGCGHSCLYCYARFMKRFTNHSEPWGNFVDVKINAPELIPENTEKYRNKTMVIGSVTDSYQPLEKKYKLTRQILEKLISLQPRLNIITKSDIILRDIDLLKQFDNCIIAVSASFIDNRIRRELEPGSISTKRRLDVLRELHEAGLQTVLFVSPIFPEVSDWATLIDLSKDFVDEYWFENLNLYSSIKNNVYEFLRKHNPDLIPKYREIYSTNSHYWSETESKIKNYCDKNKLKYKTYFHHKI